MRTYSNGYALLCGFIFLFFCCGSAAAQSKTMGDFDTETGTDITKKFKKFMLCNEDPLLWSWCEKDPAAKDFLYDVGTTKNMQKYHFILVPGGDYDFFSELLVICEFMPDEEITCEDISSAAAGNVGFIEDFEDLCADSQQTAEQLVHFLRSYVCPNFEKDPDHLYNAVMGAYESYIEFMTNHRIPVTRLGFSVEVEAQYIGDRIHKLDLLADLISDLEAADNASGQNYVLIGHSFGGANISDFLVELLNAHTAGTPEGTFFANTHVRNWPAAKKAAIYEKIKGAVFINTGVQGDKSSETKLTNDPAFALDPALGISDPVKYYIEEDVLKNYTSGVVPTDLNENEILNFVIRSNTYRVRYYLKDINNATLTPGRSIQDAFDKIAEKVIISIGCVVPRYFPDLRAGRTILVNASRQKYEDENELNDGLVDTYGSFFPRDSVEHLVLKNKDHGTLVLRPEFPGITTGHSYNQRPFIKTLLKRLESRLGAE